MAAAHRYFQLLPTRQPFAYSFGTRAHGRSRRNRMKQVFDESRRQLLKKVALGTVLIPVALRTASAADLPLVSDDDPTAKALKYTPDVSKATGAKPGSKCGNCSLYQGGTAAQ